MIREWIPRDIAEELVLCQRHCWSIVSDATATFARIAVGMYVTTTLCDCMLHLPVEMRIVPSLTVTADEWQIRDAGTDRACTALSVLALTSTNKIIGLRATTAATTTGNPGLLGADNNAGRRLTLDAGL